MNSFKYRDHRGSLADSMDTVQVMASLHDLERHLFPAFGGGEITVEAYGYDKRIEWDTHIVCHNGRAVGFTDGPVQ